MDQTVPHYSPSLDGWRGLAIGSLYVGHFYPVAGINLGALGVNLFSAYYLLEKPARSWLNRRWGAPERPPAAPAVPAYGEVAS